MGVFYDSVPLSAIVKIRDLMFTIKDPYRLDQGDVSFDAPDTFKQGMLKAIAAGFPEAVNASVAYLKL